MLGILASYDVKIPKMSSTKTLKIFMWRCILGRRPKYQLLDRSRVILSHFGNSVKQLNTLIPAPHGFATANARTRRPRVQITHPGVIYIAFPCIMQMVHETVGMDFTAKTSARCLYKSLNRSAGFVCDFMGGARTLNTSI